MKFVYPPTSLSLRGSPNHGPGSERVALRADDQRNLAFEQGVECPFSSTLFTNTPSRWLRFTNLEFQVSVQRKLGADLFKMA